MNFEENTCTCMCLYLGMRYTMYTIQEIKSAWLGKTTVDGMQQMRGGVQGTWVAMICGYTNVWCRPKQHVCGRKEIIKKYQYFL